MMIYLALLYLHIATMSVAFIAIIFALIMQLVSTNKPSGTSSQLSLASALVGIGSGGILLIFAPTPATCIKLAAFLVLYATLYAAVRRLAQVRLAQS